MSLLLLQGMFTFSGIWQPLYPGEQPFSINPESAGI